MTATDLEVPSSDRISMEPEDQSTSANMDALQVPTKKKRLIRSPTPGTNRASSTTPVRGRSQTPFNVYLTRRSEDPNEPVKWRSITPFINRDDKERTPFELGKDIRAQLISHKMVFDKASVMDVSETDFEPVRYITSDISVVDRAAVMDISNVEVIYMVEEYEEEEIPEIEEDKEEEQEEKTKKKKPRKGRKSKSMDKEDSPVSTDGDAKKKEPKTKKKGEKKKKEESRSPSPPPLPKLTLKLELGGGPKMNKKMFEQKPVAADAKPPAKAPKQSVAVQSAKQQQTARAGTSETRSQTQDIDGTDGLDDDTEIDHNTEEYPDDNIMEDDLDVDVEEEEDEEALLAKQMEIEAKEMEEKRAAEEAEKIEAIKREIEMEKKREREREREKRRLAAIEEGRPTPEQLVLWEKIAAEEGEEFMDKIKKFTQQKRNDPKNPTFISYLPNTTAVEGQSIRIVCAANGDDLSIKWFRNDEEIHTGDRYKIAATKNNILSLSIATCCPADTGEYSCLIANKQKKVKSSCFVSIYDLSRFQDEPSVPTIAYVEDTYHYINDELMIECRVHGTPRPTVTWSRENYEIKKEHALFEDAHGIYRMVIKNPCPNDTGIYVVRAVNQRGEYERKHCVEFFVTTEKVIY